MDFASVRGDCFIGKARNNLVNQFISSNADVLFFIDADQGWSPEAVLRMVQDEHEIIGGVVPKKTPKLEFNGVVLDTNENHDCYVENGFMKVKQIGTGFLKISRSAIDKMIKAYPEQYHPGDFDNQPLHYNLFHTELVVKGDAPPRFYGEDILFCKKWTAIGGTLWIDPNINFNHIGRNSWDANFLDFLQENCKVETDVKPIDTDF